MHDTQASHPVTADNGNLGLTAFAVTDCHNGGDPARKVYGSD